MTLAEKLAATIAAASKKVADEEAAQAHQAALDAENPIYMKLMFYIADLGIRFYRDQHGIQLDIPLAVQAILTPIQCDELQMLCDEHGDYAASLTAVRSESKGIKFLSLGEAK